MQISSYILLMCLSALLCGCEQGSIPAFYNKELMKSYSPDKRCYFTVSEHGNDSTDTTGHTQVFMNFKGGGGGVYSAIGFNKDIKAWWKNNKTIVIETHKEYKSYQQWPKVQFWGDIITVEYVYK